MRFRKKPVVVEAIQWDGSNFGEIKEFVGFGCVQHVKSWSREFDNTILIVTLEGDMRANVGDWIIRGVNGEFYLCKPDIFEQTYERVEGESEEG